MKLNKLNKQEINTNCNELFVDSDHHNLKDTFVINPDGSKNSILPLMVSKILVPGKTIFANVPSECEDIKTMSQILTSLGLKCKFDKSKLEINNLGISENIKISDSLSSKTRYSSLFLGVFASLNRNFKIPFPGGCQLQEKRPLDIHYDCLRKIGYQVDEKENFIECKSLPSLKDEISVIMKKISVGATLNSIFSSILRNQKTIIENVAIEPEIKDLIDFLNKSEANIKFDEKNRKIIIIGTKKIRSVNNWNVIDDRISGMTYFMAALMQNRSAILKIDYKLVQSSLEKLQEIGYPIKIQGKYIIYHKTNGLRLKAQNIEFTPYPGIPTDLQPIFCLLMTQVPGKSLLEDKVFNQRTQYIKELVKFGANIDIKNIKGKYIINISYSKQLKGSNATCIDIRGGMAVILSALMAEGKSIISNIYQVRRGYNSFKNTLKNFGFSISFNENDKNFIKMFLSSQWPIKINEPWEKTLHNPILSKDSNICILGDCFARNFCRWFKEQGLETGNIPWGIHFHQKAILKELQRLIKKDDTPDEYWKLRDNNGKIHFIDPFRHPVVAETLSKLKEKQDNIEKSKLSYFNKTDLFVISLSIGEVWEQKINGKWHPLGRGPTIENFNPKIFRYRTLSIIETKQDIKSIISAIKEINPKSKIIFMVSPVPLKHSLHDEHIFISNNKSKTTLLSAIYDVMDSKLLNVFYFPAYEIVLKDNKKSYWQKDKRHITAECIVDICKYFVSSYFSNPDKEMLLKNNGKIFKIREVDEDGNIIKELEPTSLIKVYQEINDVKGKLNSNILNNSYNGFKTNENNYESKFYEKKIQKKDKKNFREINGTEQNLVYKRDSMLKERIVQAKKRKEYLNDYQYSGNKEIKNKNYTLQVIGEDLKLGYTFRGSFEKENYKRQTFSKGLFIPQATEKNTTLSEQTFNRDKSHLNSI